MVTLDQAGRVEVYKEVADRDEWSSLYWIDFFTYVRDPTSRYPCVCVTYTPGMPPAPSEVFVGGPISRPLDDFIWRADEPRACWSTFIMVITQPKIRRQDLLDYGFAPLP